MGLKGYLGLMVFGTLVCWIAWALVLFNIDPSSGGTVGTASFLLSLFLALLGTFSLLGFIARRTFQHEAVAFDHIGISLRQAFFFSLILVGVLLLKATGLYAWWNVVFLVAACIVLEFFFITRDTT